MSDNQRRAWCRILFLAFCAFPTSLVGYKIFHPQTTADWEGAIQAKLGFETSIDSIETPGPYVTILRGLEFSDPEIGTLFRAVEARVFFDKDVNTVVVPYRVRELNNVGLVTLVDQLNRNLIRSEGVEKLWRIVFEDDQNQPVETSIARYEHRLQETAPGVAVIPPPSVVLDQLEIHVVPEIGGTSVKAAFHVKGQEQRSDRVVCSASRTARDGKWLQLETNGYDLPCWLLESKVPQLTTELGEYALFAGNTDFSPIIGAPKLSVDGMFKTVDLAKSNSAIKGRDQFASIKVNSRLENQILEGEAKLIQEDSSVLRLPLDPLAPYSKSFSPALAIRSAIRQRLEGVRVSDSNPDLQYAP